jgi:hypothetical protein
MNRRAFVGAAAYLVSLAFASAAIAQAAKPTPATTPSQSAPATPAKWVPPVKGLATIEVIQGQSKVVGKDIVTVLKVKNTSTGSIALLRVDEYWYDKALKQVSGDSQNVRKPINPGEVVEVTLKSPLVPNLARSQYVFSHANGKVSAKGVKKFSG